MSPDKAIRFAKGILNGYSSKGDVPSTEVSLYALAMILAGIAENYDKQVNGV